MVLDTIPEKRNQKKKNRTKNSTTPHYQCQPVPSPHPQKKPPNFSLVKYEVFPCQVFVLSMHKQEITNMSVRRF